MSIREMLEQDEELRLSPLAQLSTRTRGSNTEEEACDIRPAYQHDRDRILHSKSFRRLKHKTQVFLAPTGRSLPYPVDPHPGGFPNCPNHSEIPSIK